MASSSSLLVTADVARLLRVHPKQVYRLMAKGLPARRVGGEWRFVEADVLAWASGEKVPAPGQPCASLPSAAHERASLPAAPSLRAPPLLAANGDVVVDVLLDHLVLAKAPLVGFVRADCTAALRALGERAVLFAAYHGGPPPKQLHDARIARIHLVNREVGLASKKAIRSIDALAGKTLAGRPETAGICAHLDRALAVEKTSRKKLRIGEVAHASHGDAVLAVHRGEADAALTTAAWAERAGLTFFALAAEPYDVLLFAEDLGRPHAVAMCEVTQGRAFHTAVAGRAGYDASRTGTIRYDFDDDAP